MTRYIDAVTHETAVLVEVSSGMRLDAQLQPRMPSLFSFLSQAPGAFYLDPMWTISQPAFLLHFLDQTGLLQRPPPGAPLCSCWFFFLVSKQIDFWMVQPNKQILYLTSHRDFFFLA